MNKSKFQIIYSIFILIVVPVLIAVNTILLATSVRKDYDSELQSRAELANSVLAVSMQDYIVSNQPDIALEKINYLAETQKEFRNVAVLVKQDSEYNVFAASESNFSISDSDILQYDIALSRKWPISKNIPARTSSGQTTRAWNVATPILDSSGNAYGIVTSDLLTVDVDEKFDSTLSRSILIMIISAIAVIVLLMNHFRLIGTANLLRKQKELNQTMSDFLSVASHELKAPMTIIKGYISNVTEGDYGDIPDDATKQLNIAAAQTDRQNELVQDLLNVSRIEQGRIKFDVQPVNITDTINSIISMYKKKAQEKGIEIIYQGESASYWVLADSGRTTEIFTNLIDNAIKYSQKGEVRITHEPKGKYLETSVRDTGIGMSSEERSRLFQRFYRVKNEKTKDISGTGLGLWIIKQYIEKMGGKIEVDSLIDSGTEFRVSLKSTIAPQQQSVNEVDNRTNQS